MTGWIKFQLILSCNLRSRSVKYSANGIAPIRRINRFDYMNSKTVDTSKFPWILIPGL
jgi:hypothetical protein